jgi:ribosome-binding protein aMBF1 (putative translation factor)
MNANQDWQGTNQVFRGIMPPSPDATRSEEGDIPSRNDDKRGKPMSIPTTPPTAARVIDARRALGLSRDKFAELLRSSKRTVARWEAGESTVYPQVLFEFARRVHRLAALAAT